jgi:hypothetical protein
MLTGMTEDDWATVLEVFDAVQLHRGEPGHNDRKFLRAHFGIKAERMTSGVGWSGNM